jgi:hypothetical protein
MGVGGLESTSRRMSSQAKLPLGYSGFILKAFRFTPLFVIA